MHSIFVKSNHQKANVVTNKKTCIGIKFHHQVKQKRNSNPTHSTIVFILYLLLWSLI